MSAPYRPFGRVVENLPNCTLTLGMSEADAAVLGAMLETIDPWLTLGVSANALTRYLLRDDPALYRYVVRLDDEIGGLICIRYPWLRGPYIELLGIGSAHQGKRLGSEVLAWTEAEARHEARNLWVITSSFNGGARRFYARHGFSEVGAIEGLVAEGHAEVLLRKSLD